MMSRKKLKWIFNLLIKALKLIYNNLIELNNYYVIRKMATLIAKIIPDSWDDEEFELDFDSLKTAAEEPVSKPVASPVAVTFTAEPEQVIKIKNEYAKYPYFMAGLEGTLLKELFPRAEYPVVDLKKSLETSAGLLKYVNSVRNYVKALFYVLKSTKYYTPVTKARVAPKSKKERIDPDLAYVSIEDQMRVYKLFGFQGHVGSKKDNEDYKRDELLGLLKGIIYNVPVLTHFVMLLLQRIYVTSLNQSDIRRTCEQIKSCVDYEYKLYSLSAYWYHNTSWKKLWYVYGENTLDMICGGDGAITSEMASCVMKSASYQK